MVLDPQVSPGEMKRREVVLDPQVSPGEMKRREVVLDPQVSPGEMKRREVEPGSESWTILYYNSPTAVRLRTWSL